MEFYNDELYHHGMQGMKWGVKHGPPYPIKSGSSSSSVSKKTKKKNRILSKLTGKKAKKKVSVTSQKKEDASKKIKSMSDSELRDKISRLELEKKYSDLMNARNKKRTSRGKAFVTDVLEKSGKNIATQLTTYAMGTAINKMFGSDIVNPKKGQKDK